ncbi:MAG: Lrp/AsnC ligand binding domain-containing protein [Candidatus Woesearchaeota archaeon]|nr:Lrp/AsnC ligand binding domain-containing protein [Candidatus Woesearchaeota archaeon]
MTKVYLLLRTENSKLGIVKAQLSKFEEIKELDEVFGRYDLIAKIETENSPAIKRFIQNKIRVQEGIKSIETVFAAEE